MASSRYWRLVGLRSAAGGSLTLSEVALRVGGTRVDTSATLTCSHTPTGGSLANLYDANLATTCTFSSAQYSAAGFYLQWDFGSTQTLDEIMFGSGSSSAEFVYGYTLQYLSGSTWVPASRVRGISYPGANTLTTSATASLIPTTWNPADKGSACVLSNGNLTGTAPAINGSVRSIFSTSSGKWYWEITTTSTTYSPGIGIGTAAASLANYPGSSSGAWAWFGNKGKKYTGGVSATYGTAGSIATSVIGVALDMTAGTITLYKNGVSLGVMYSGISGDIYALCGGNASVASDWTANFGATAFAYSPPAGHQAGFGDLDVRGPVTSTLVIETSGSFIRPVYSEAVVGTTGLIGRNSGDIRTLRDIYTAGRGQITATVKIDGTPTDTPVRRKVRLFRDRDGLFVRETWSDATTGAYSFTEIDENETYTVVSYDYTENYRAVIADRITPTVA